MLTGVKNEGVSMVTAEVVYHAEDREEPGFQSSGGGSIQGGAESWEEEVAVD